MVDERVIYNVQRGVAGCIDYDLYGNTIEAEPILCKRVFIMT